MTPLPEPARGQFEGPLHRYAVSVYFEDTDAGGMVYHANYLRWFERARTDILRLLGIGQRAALEAGEGAYVVADAQIRFLAPARLDDVVIIESSCEAVQAASVRIRQTALRGSDRLVEAAVRVGFVGRDGKARRQPDSWRERFASLVASPEG